MFVIADGGVQYTGVGGTSVAAPLWAGFTALVNQRAAQVGQSPVGFINPAVYAIGSGGNYVADFNDVTSGNNYWSSSPTDYPATAGYDLCTGWGTPRANLIDALAIPDALGISPGTGFDAIGPVGGPFNVSSENFLLTNASNASLDWSLLGVPSWLDVSCSGGTLAADSCTAVTVSLNSATSNLLAGIYSTNLIFTNQTSHFVQTRLFTLEVGQPLVRNGGFEAGNFSSWTLEGSHFVNFVNDGSSYKMTPHSGTYSVAMGQPKTLAYLSQTLITIPGKRYALSFWWCNPIKGSGQQLAVNWNTNSSGTNIIYNNTSPAATAWTNILRIVTATGTSTVLRFAARNDPVFFGLDDVVVSTNLALADRSRPTNLITAPVANQRWSNIVCLVTGKASDNVGVSNVLYSLNNGSWTSATTGNEWTNWSVALT
ncbi:MAG TPA: carbohydrate binding domain-containing protein, partial [Candidatus Dormibacteraeota bacterium]|nr:carbohydrate binding domain-containing protein [Candidatus Dormibacteraeota bacterium]